MAAAAKEEYGRGAVYGSLAYNYDNPELFREEELETQREAAAPRTGTQTQTRIRTRARAVIHTKQGIAPLAILGGLIAAFLCVTAITAQIRLLGVSGDSVELQTKLAELKEDQARLRIAYESAFNLAEIEEYATTELGMRKPAANQITYIDTSAPDKAVVIGAADDESFVDRAADFLSGFGEYFR